MHQISLGGRCSPAVVMKAAAANNSIYVSIKNNCEHKSRTLPYPNVWMVKESQRRAHQLPYPHLLEETQLAETCKSCKNFGNNRFFHIFTRNISNLPTASKQDKTHQRELAPSKVKCTLPNSYHQRMQRHRRYSRRMHSATTNPGH